MSSTDHRGRLHNYDYVYMATNNPAIVWDRIDKRVLRVSGLLGMGVPVGEFHPDVGLGSAETADDCDNEGDD